MNDLSRVHLNGLRAVEAVARLGSLGAAARELGVTAGAISQQVARTEAALGRRLFLRGAQGMDLTEAGRDVAPLLREGFERLAMAVARARPARDAVLTLSVAPILASRWLIWQLPDFSARHPDIRVRLDADVRLVDPNLSDVDLCIRVGPGNWPGVAADWLFPHLVGPVCAPALAATIRTPADLARVPVITEPRPLIGWQVWLDPLGLTPEILGAGPEFSDSALCLDAAISGAGVFLAFEVVAAEALARGTLVALPPGFRQSGLGYWLVTARDRSPSPAVRAFRRWLKDRIAASGFGGGPA